ESFLELFGDGPVSLLRAPARINVLGEHVDYVSYLPTASLTFGSRERDMLMMYRQSDQPRIRGGSTSARYEFGSFDLLPELPAATRGTDDEWLSYLYLVGTPAPTWLNYPHGAVDFATFKFGERVRNGFDFIVDSTIPAGGGASSSSALVVLAGAAIRNVNRIVFERIELARDSARAEWFIGTRGGSMDHTTICLGERQRGVLISYSSQKVERVSLPDSSFQWITFFTKAADKGREVMIEYNERAAVSRILIPAVISGWETQFPERYREWQNAISSFSSNGNAIALNQIALLIEHLPQTISLEAIQNDYPDAFAECERSFPALVEDRARWPIALRDRAQHHIGEVNRVALAAALLESDRVHDGSSVCQSIGTLLNESHLSLRDLYGVSTADVERLIEIIRSDPKVFGGRLMGGGFGGNVLVLTTAENTSSLVDRVQSQYYKPQGRDGFAEGSVMISTPGDGLSDLGMQTQLKSSVELLSIRQEPTNTGAINWLLDEVTLTQDKEHIWPIIVAAGRGSRAMATGLDRPKPLALINGQPAILRVLENVRSGIGNTRPPIIITSPDNTDEIRLALRDQDVHFAVQPKALGTGDAVLNTFTFLRDFEGIALVVWSTQPVIRKETYRRTLALQTVFGDYDLIVPTTLKDLPYAPIQRDSSGLVSAASETHLESAEPIPFGETNIGLFVLNNQKMLRALLDLKRRYWNATEGRYERRGGELGFPNELINYFSGDTGKIFASPIADPREEQGIKRLEDVALCERFIAELESEAS
ncbi:MAG TPA: NTP transferase domain-containing protein, partial [Pyrinomonadaceae bacterium]|nr:NTP transferase domain-containing protein [Pyrinomonadaceae bacterium]